MGVVCVCVYVCVYVWRKNTPYFDVLASRKVCIYGWEFMCVCGVKVKEVSSGREQQTLVLFICICVCLCLYVFVCVWCGVFVWFMCVFLSSSVVKILLMLCFFVVSKFYLCLYVSL